MANDRMTELNRWQEQLAHLVSDVRSWAEPLGWSPKEIRKRMNDPELGEIEVPALLLQQDLVRVLLEPIGRNAPGAESVVDLYLMPAYDDIASLYFYDGEWHIHYAFAPSAVASVKEGEAKPLNEATFASVLEQMKAHA
jgi:hypothetical protein